MTEKAGGTMRTQPVHRAYTGCAPAACAVGALGATALQAGTAWETALARNEWRAPQFHLTAQDLSGGIDDPIVETELER